MNASFHIVFIFLWQMALLREQINTFFNSINGLPYSESFKSTLGITHLLMARKAFSGKKAKEQTLGKKQKY